MTAVYLTAPQTLELGPCPPAAPAAGEHLVELLAAGICGTDLHAYHGDSPFVEFPRILGHELVGTVVGGDGPLPAGTVVVVDPRFACGNCRACRLGRRNCCVNLRVFGAHVDGGLRNRFALPATMLHPLPPGVPPALGTLVEPLSIGANACLRGEVSAGETVLVQGAGTIGLCALLVAKAQGATVYVADALATRLDLARHLGADAVINVREENDAARLAELTGGEGPGVVIEAAGRAAVLARALELVGAAGIVVSLMISRETLTLPVTTTLIKKELDLRGSRLNRDLFPFVLDLLGTGRMAPAPLITHRFPLAAAAAAFHLADTAPAEVVKVVLEA